MNEQKVKSAVDGVEIVDNFSYLGYMIQRDSVCDKSVMDRVSKGLLKFRELSGVEQIGRAHV